jgi:IS1 family transposase
LCSKKCTTAGFGWPFVARRDKWSPLRLGIGAGKTCQRLWEAIPEKYRQGHCETSFWATYAAVIPEEQHTAVGPRNRRNGSRGAVKQHLAPTTGPFCPYDVIIFQVRDHATPVCLLLFLHRYNTERAILLK